MIEVNKYIFPKRSIEYNLRNYRELAFHRKLTSTYGLKGENYKASQIWQKVPMAIKNSGSLEIFKLKVKSWTSDICPCWVC